MVSILEKYSSQPNGRELKTLAQGTARDLRSLQIKLTYVGPQGKPLPTVVFTTFYHLIQLHWFLPLRRANLHYNNDDIAAWTFTVAPDEILRVVKALVGLQATQAPAQANDPFLSLMLAMQDSRLGPVEFESVLDRANTEVVIGAIHAALDKSNGLARTVIGLQQKSLFT